jgi:hypothetical protein
MFSWDMVLEGLVGQLAHAQGIMGVVFMVTTRIFFDVIVDRGPSFGFHIVRIHSVRLVDNHRP